MRTSSLYALFEQPCMPLGKWVVSQFERSGGSFVRAMTSSTVYQRTVIAAFTASVISNI